jgi:hypothetical protein
MYGSDFQSLSFPKKGKEIIEKSKVRREANARLVDEKKSEIQKLCKEHNIDAVKMFTNLDALRGNSSRELPSQEMAKLQQLAHRVDELEKENERLGLLIRNLPENTDFNLTFDELKFFGF